MKKTKQLPARYFDNQEFHVDETDEEKVFGVIGKNPSAYQLLKFELCTYIDNLINSKELKHLEIQKLAGISSGDIIQIRNHNLECFTIDELIRIYTLLDDNQNGIGTVLSSIGDRISRVLT